MLDKVSKWLLARPANGVLGLMVVYSLPLVGVLSSAVLVLLVVKLGVRRAALSAAAAAGLLAVAAMLGRGAASITPVIVSLVSIWGPGFLLALFLTSTRSLTLTVQVSVLVGFLALSLFFAVVADPVSFWQQMLNDVAAAWRAQGVEQMGDVVAELLPYAEFMTLLMVVTLWVVHTGLFVLGYTWSRRISGDNVEYGRFVDLNLGKVIAALMAAASLLAVLTSVMWAQNIAVFLFCVFWLHGLSVLHWLRTEERIPDALVLMTYAFLFVPFFSVFTVMVLALAGYTDAWFDARKRLARG